MKKYKEKNTEIGEVSILTNRYQKKKMTKLIKIVKIQYCIILKKIKNNKLKSRRKVI